MQKLPSASASTKENSITPALTTTGDVNGDSGTIRSNLSAITVANSQSVLPVPIDYLVPMQKLPSASASTKENSITPALTTTDTTSTEDVQESLLPSAKTSSEEETSNNRSKGSSDN